MAHWLKCDVCGLTIIGSQTVRNPGEACNDPHCSGHLVQAVIKWNRRGRKPYKGQVVMAPERNRQRSLNE